MIIVDYKRKGNFPPQGIVGRSPIRCPMCSALQYVIAYSEGIFTSKCKLCQFQDSIAEMKAFDRLEFLPRIPKNWYFVYNFDVPI